MGRQNKRIVCPLGGDGLGGKFKFWILYHLLGGPRRFGELRRLLPDASRQMLTTQLRDLEEIGLLHRRVYMQVPPRVEYSLTEMGRDLEPMLREMQAWGEWYGEQTGPENDWLLSLSGRWKFWIWYLLLERPMHSGELQRRLPGASRQMLSINLRELEQMGVLYRRATPRAPGSPGTEYALTEVGERSGPVLRRMYAWARWCCDRLGLEYEWPVSGQTGVEDLASRGRTTAA